MQVKGARIQIGQTVLKTILITLVSVVAVFLAAIFVAPSFVDWNQYRDELTAYAKSFTGRELEIKGDIKFAILPSPILVIRTFG